MTVCPTEGSGDAVTVTFTEFDTEGGFDFLSVYEGPDLDGEFIAEASGTTIPGPYTSTDESGCLTFLFESDGSSNGAGWRADVTCAPS